MNFLNGLSSQFSPAAIVAAVIFWLLECGLMWTLGHKPVRRVAFGILLLLANMAIVTFAMSSLRTPERHELRPAIEQLVVGETQLTNSSGTTEPPTAFCALMVSIRNTGVPTAVSGYKAIVTFRDGTTAIGAQRAIVNEFKIDIGGGSTMTLFSDDALDRRTLAPIVTGGIAQGFLIFTFGNIQSASLKSSDSSVTLSMEDSWNTNFTANRVLGPFGTGASVPQMPGLRMQPLVIPKGDVAKPSVQDKRRAQ